MVLMKVLFLCRANIGRSQIAKALYDKINKGKSESAGTKVNEERQKMKLGEVIGAENVTKCMKKEGIDISQSPIKQVTPEMINWADKIIILTDKEDVPNFVLESKKLEFWDVKDPKGTDLAFHCRTKEQIKELIEDMLKSSKQK